MKTEVGMIGVMNAGADFSDCGRYRWRLRREWDATKPVACFIMLNPSIAGGLVNDPTVVRCIQRAIFLGCGALEVANLFCLVATDPAALLQGGTAHTVGAMGDEAYMMAAHEAQRTGGPIICAWGSHPATRPRAFHVVDRLRSAGYRLQCLGVNRDRMPKHPLYVPYSVQLRDYSYL